MLPTPSAVNASFISIIGRSEENFGGKNSWSNCVAILFRKFRRLSKLD